MGSCDCATGERAATAPTAADFRATTIPGGNGVVLFVGLALLALHSAFVLREAFRAGVGGPQWFGRLRARVLCATDWIVGRRRQCQTDAMELRVDRDVQLKIQAGMTHALQQLVSLEAFYLLTICFSLAAQSTDRWMSFGQTAVFMATFGVLLLMSVSRSQRLARRPSVGYSFVMAQCCIILYFSRFEATSVLLLEGVALVVRSGISVVFHDASLVFIWNALYAGVGAYVCVSTFSVEFCNTVLFYQVMTTLSVLILSRTARRACEREVRREVETTELRAESSGLWRLLDMICDVVVPLDARLRIADQALRFSAMVTLQGKDVQGMQLQDFMPEVEDRMQFETVVGASVADVSCPESSLPYALHVRLRDSLGNTIRAEMFCVAVRTPLRTGCLVGIREFSDPSPIPECVSFPRQAPGRRRRCGLVPGRGRRWGRYFVVAILQADAVDSLAASGWRHGGRPHADGSMRRVGSEPPPQSPSEGGSSADPAEPPRAMSAAGDMRGRRIPTSEMGMDLALVQLMQLVEEAPPNIVESEGAGCCPFHRRAASFQSRLNTLAEINCASDFRPKVAAAQCQECGLLVDRTGDAARAAAELGSWRHQCFACEATVTLGLGAAPPPMQL